jgi:aminoglycoside phosphotransferase (APT) family kinase protein
MSIVFQVGTKLAVTHGDVRLTERRSLTGGAANVLFAARLSGRDVPTDWPTDVVVRLYPEARDGAERKRAIQEFCRAGLYPAVRPLATGEVRGYAYLLLERVRGGETTARFLVPWRRRSTLEEVVDLHVRLHRLPIDGWPYPSDIRTADWWIKELRSAGRLDLRPAIDWLDANRPSEQGEPRICHFDFTSSNVLRARDGRLTVIDWELAALGDPVSDIAFAVEKLALVPGSLPSAARRPGRFMLGPRGPALLRAYAGREPIDEPRLRYWRALYCVLLGHWTLGSRVAGVAIRPRYLRRLTRHLPAYAAGRFRALTA